jgi:hypothetical protein
VQHNYRYKGQESRNNQGKETKHSEELEAASASDHCVVKHRLCAVRQFHYFG